MKRTILLTLSFLLTLLVSAQWKTKQPGHGGHVQDMVHAKAKPGRVYLVLLNNASVGGGIMLIYDIEAFYSGSTFVGVGHSTEAAASVNVQDIAADPQATGPEKFLHFFLKTISRTWTYSFVISLRTNTKRNPHPGSA